MFLKTEAAHYDSSSSDIILQSSAQPSKIDLDECAPTYPDYDKYASHVPKAWVAIGLAFLTSVLCFTWGIYIFVYEPDTLVYASHIDIEHGAIEVLKLLVNFYLTFIADTLGYVHSVSLRWALYREKRLEFNTNIRLFTSSKTSLPNRWYINLVAAVSLMMSYAASSLLIFPTIYLGTITGATAPQASVNGMALLFLGLGFMGQGITAVLCMRHHKKDILSWSSNPLNSALAVLHQNIGIQHRPGRCMVPLQPTPSRKSGRSKKGAVDTDPLFTSETPSPQQPKWKQPSLWALKSAKHIFAFLWIMPILLCGAMYAVPYLFTSFISFGGLSTVSAQYQNAVQYLFTFAVLFLIQGVLTLALHVLELLVFMKRDEGIWRSAASKSGTTPLESSPVKLTLRSWQAMLLFVTKAVHHWLFGFSVGFEAQVIESFKIFQVQINQDLPVMAVATALPAAFATVMAFWSPHGPQPAAYGHLQTIADLVDDWDMPNGRMFWGDKGETRGSDEVRHAGTSGIKERLSYIQMDKVYAGVRM